MTAPTKPDFHRIHTVEELTTYPRSTVILDLDGRPFKRGPAEDGQDHWTSGEIKLPALLLWHPAWHNDLHP